MNSIYKTRTKTIGPQSAKLLISLHERGQSVFTLSDVQEILGLNETSVRQFTHKLVQRGIVTRLKPGLFILVPFELGDVSRFRRGEQLAAYVGLTPSQYSSGDKVRMGRITCRLLLYL